MYTLSIIHTSDFLEGKTEMRDTRERLVELTLRQDTMTSSCVAVGILSAERRELQPTVTGPSAAISHVLTPGCGVSPTSSANRLRRDRISSPALISELAGDTLLFVSLFLLSPTRQFGSVSSNKNIFEDFYKASVRKNLTFSFIPPSKLGACVYYSTSSSSILHSCLIFR